MSQKNTGWGGQRPGAGRKAITLTTAAVTKMLERAEEFAKKKKKDIDTILLEMIYDEEGKTSERIACIKLWKDYTIPKVKEGGLTDEEVTPEAPFKLPPKKGDPAKIVNIKPDPVDVDTT